MHKRLYWLLVLLLACNSGEKIESIPDDTPPAFGICQALRLPQGLQLQVQLDTASAGVLAFQLYVNNQTNQQYTIAPGEATLVSEGGYRQTPTSEQQRQTIAAGASASFRWNYRPINDLYLYQRTRLSGPYNERYRLPLSFIEGLRDTLVFCFSHERYLSYRAKQAAKKPQLYKPSSAVLQPEKTTRQEQYWKTIADSTGSTHFTEQEFFTGGINIRHALYAYNDSLHLQLQLINHAPYALRVVPEEITLSYKDKRVQPLSWQLPPGQLSTPAPYLIRKGERLPLEVTFPVAPTADSLWLTLQGIKLQAADKPIFAEDFLFIRE